MNTTEYEFSTLIQFRPTPLLGLRLAAKAREWGVSECETARRLTAMAACGLDVEYYPLLARLASKLAPGGSRRSEFVQACDQVRIGLDSCEYVREDLSIAPMTAEQRKAYVPRMIQDCIDDAICVRQMCGTGDEEDKLYELPEHIAPISIVRPKDGSNDDFEVYPGALD